MGERTVAARAEVVAAREALAAEYGQLGKSTRAAVDIPAKVRRAPLQSAALAGGAAFLVLGGPGRIFGRVKRAVFGAPPPLPSSMLPEEIERAIRNLGSDGDALRGSLERSFADYLDKQGGFARRQVRNATSEALAGTIRLGGRAVGLTLVRRLLAGETGEIDSMVQRARSMAKRPSTADGDGAAGDGPVGGGDAKPT